jgi:hypothetical protein
MTTTKTLEQRMRFFEDYISFQFDKSSPVVISLKVKNLSNILDGRDNIQINNIDLALMSTLQYLVVRVQKCVFGYTNHNEILLLLHCNDNQPWMNYNVQKMLSTCSSYATQIFNRYLHTMDLMLGKRKPPTDNFFEAKGFNIPHNEVINYFIYKQNFFSVKMKRRIIKEMTGDSLYKIKNNELDILAKDYKIDWNEYTGEINGSMFTPEMPYEEYVRFGTDCITAPNFVDSLGYFDTYIQEKESNAS